MEFAFEWVEAVIWYYLAIFIEFSLGNSNFTLSLHFTWKLTFQEFNFCFQTLIIFEDYSKTFLTTETNSEMQLLMFNVMLSSK